MSTISDKNKSERRQRRMNGSTVLRKQLREQKRDGTGPNERSPRESGKRKGKKLGKCKPEVETMEESVETMEEVEEPEVLDKEVKNEE